MIVEEFATPMLVVAVALLDDRSRVLMQRRRIGQAHGGLWEFPGGKVERGETIEAALLREIEEELGITLNRNALRPLSFAGDALLPQPPARPCVILLYTCRHWAGELQCLSGEEIRWFDPQEVPGLPMPTLDYPLARDLLSSI